MSFLSTQNWVSVNQVGNQKKIDGYQNEILCNFPFTTEIFERTRDVHCFEPVWNNFGHPNTLFCWCRDSIPTFSCRPAVRMIRLHGKILSDDSTSTTITSCLPMRWTIEIVPKYSWDIRKPTVIWPLGLECTSVLRSHEHEATVSLIFGKQFSRNYVLPFCQPVEGFLEFHLSSVHFQFQVFSGDRHT